MIRAYGIPVSGEINNCDEAAGALEAAAKLIGAGLLREAVEVVDFVMPFVREAVPESEKARADAREEREKARAQRERGEARAKEIFAQSVTLTPTHQE